MTHSRGALIGVLPYSFNIILRSSTQLSRKNCKRLLKVTLNVVSASSDAINIVAKKHDKKRGRRPRGDITSDNGWRARENNLYKFASFWVTIWLAIFESSEAKPLRWMRSPKILKYTKFHERHPVNAATSILLSQHLPWYRFGGDVLLT